MSRRTLRVAEQIQQILGDVIQNELKDPRVGFATVVGVEMTPDLLRAKVKISVLGDAETQKEAMAGLQRARGFLRHRIGEELRHMRSVPELHLSLDTSLDYTLHIESVLRDVASERERNPPKLDGQEGQG